MNVYYEIYGGWIRTAGIRGKTITLLDQEVYQKFSATRILYCSHAEKISPNFLAPRQRLSSSTLTVITNIPYKSLLFVQRCRILMKPQII